MLENPRKINNFYPGDVMDVPALRGSLPSLRWTAEDSIVFRFLGFKTRGAIARTDLLAASVLKRMFF